MIDHTYMSNSTYNYQPYEQNYQLLDSTPPTRSIDPLFLL